MHDITQIDTHIALVLNLLVPADAVDGVGVGNLVESHSDDLLGLDDTKGGKDLSNVFPCGLV